MTLHPQAQLLIDLSAQAGLPPLPELTPAQAREIYDMRTAALDANPPIESVEDRTIAASTGELPVRIYRPVDASEAAPAIVFFHGGGWVIGTIDTHDVVCRALCAAASAVVVSVGYRLAPEHRFPAASDDCVAATEWVAANASTIGVDAARLAVCGDSAGGHLAAVVCQQARDAGGPAIAAQALVYPVTDIASLDRPSMTENGDGYLLTADAMRWFIGHYTPDEAVRTDPRCSPLRGELADLPPAIVFTAEYDPLRDEGVEYADAMVAAGSHAEHVRVAGQVHTYFTQVGFQDAAAQTVDQIATFFHTHW